MASETQWHCNLSNNQKFYRSDDVIGHFLLTMDIHRFKSLASTFSGFLSGCQSRILGFVDCPSLSMESDAGGQLMADTKTQCAGVSPWLGLTQRGSGMLGARTYIGMQESGEASAGPVQVFHQPVGFDQNLELQNPILQKNPPSDYQNCRKFGVFLRSSSVNYRSLQAHLDLLEPSLALHFCLSGRTTLGAFKTGQELGSTCS